MTRTVKHLDAAGLVERRTRADDGRLVVVSLSDAGRARLLADRRRRDEWLAQRLRELSRDEREVLRRAAPVLERLASLD
jgi:DNA-binding MarR family transcriptional regulator